MVADALAFGRALREQVIDDGDGICCDELVGPAPPHDCFAALFYPPRRFRFAQPNGPEHVGKVPWRQIRDLPQADLRKGVVAKSVNPLVDVFAVSPRWLQFAMQPSSRFFVSESFSTSPDCGALNDPLLYGVLASRD
jgi:hypothetical protein